MAPVALHPDAKECRAPAKEGLRNVSKHAHAKHVTVHVVVDNSASARPLQVQGLELLQTVLNGART